MWEGIGKVPHSPRESPSSICDFPLSKLTWVILLGSFQLYMCLGIRAEKYKAGLLLHFQTELVDRQRY